VPWLFRLAHLRRNSLQNSFFVGAIHATKYLPAARNHLRGVLQAGFSHFRAG
jgi:hypothetical protein